MGGKEVGEEGLKAWFNAAVGPGLLRKTSSEQLQNHLQQQAHNKYYLTEDPRVPQKPDTITDGRREILGATRTNTCLIIIQIKKIMTARFSIMVEWHSLLLVITEKKIFFNKYT